MPIAKLIDSLDEDGGERKEYAWGSGFVWGNKGSRTRSKKVKSLDDEVRTHMHMRVCRCMCMCACACVSVHVRVRVHVRMC